MKRLFALAIALILILSALAPVFATTATEQKLYNEAGKILKDIGVLQGSSNGDLMLDSNLRRQDMVVLISRLYNEEDRAKNYIGINIFKDLTQDQKYYIPFISWAVNKSLITGMRKDEFGFNGSVTVQQFQAVLLRALGYTEEAKTWTNVPDLAEKFGIMKGLRNNPETLLSRGQMAVMTVNALNQTKKSSSLTLAQILNIKVPEIFTVESEIKVEKNSLAFSGKVKGSSSLKLHLRPASDSITSGEKIMSITLQEDKQFSIKIDDLESGTYHYRFIGDNSQYTEFQSVTIAALPFDLSEVKSDNLKEINLIFTQPVDKTTANFVNIYNTTAGTIKDVRFEDNDKRVVLTLNGAMTQQAKHKVSISKIKSTNDVEKQIKDYEFQSFDNKLPKVVEVKQLGNTGLRIYLSEPVKSASSANFKIDNKNFTGTIKLENNIVTLTYSGTNVLSVGDHTLTVSSLEDFAGYKSIDENISFKIVKDSIAPTIKSATATSEEVVIEFSEDINPASALPNNFYWKYGALKRFSNNVRFVENKAIVQFTTHKLPNKENTIYIENITDYWNNKMSLKDIKVTPTIDNTKPELISYKVADDGKSITMYFNKNVEGTNRSAYTITDKDGKHVSIKDIQGSGREFIVNLYTTLPVGKNILVVQGIQDTTPSKNVLIPFSAVIDMKDVERPKVLSNTGHGNHIIIQFSKAMDFTTVSDATNYVMSFGGKQVYLPKDTQFTPSNDGKSVTLLLPEQIDGKKVMVGAENNLTSLDIRGLKDLNGNNTDPLIVNLKFDGTVSGKAKAVDYYNDKPGKQGVLLEENLIKIKFNIPIVQASPSDFIVAGRTILNVELNGTNEVTLHLNDADTTYIQQGLTFISGTNSMKSYIDTGVEGGQISLVDKVAPRVKSITNNLTVNGTQIELPFTEILEEEGATLYRRDLEITRLADGKVLSPEDYSTSLKSTDKSTLVISINKRDITSGYSIRVVGDSSTGKLNYIRDKDGNLAMYSDVYFNTIRDILK